jgi:hypothetical protein
MPQPLDSCWDNALRERNCSKHSARRLPKIKSPDYRHPGEQTNAVLMYVLRIPELPKLGNRNDKSSVVSHQLNQEVKNQPNACHPDINQKAKKNRATLARFWLS